jgi:hypothetical protein
VVVITGQPQHFPLVDRSTVGAATLLACYTLALLALAVAISVGATSADPAARDRIGAARQATKLGAGLRRDLAAIGAAVPRWRRGAGAGRQANLRARRRCRLRSPHRAAAAPSRTPSRGWPQARESLVVLPELLNRFDPGTVNLPDGSSYSEIKGRSVEIRADIE